MLNDLQKLIAIPSVMGAPEQGAPFGAGPKAALECFLTMAADYGLKTHNENGYCGWAEWGDGQEMLGILGHLDVVPAGEGWSRNPFTLTVEDGYLYGRGVADDKGPTVAALHALKRLRESGKKLRHRVRLIVGLNEENGSECIEYYRKHCEIPVASFVPDADFPVINSEKGILHLTLSGEADEVLRRNLLSLTAGIRPNIVPDLCTATIRKGSELYEKLASFGTDSSLFLRPEIASVLVNARLRPQDFSVHFFEETAVLEARGVAGHAMAPEKGENAAAAMIVLLSSLLSSPQLDAMRARLCAPNPADLLGIAAKDDVSGHLTVNFGMLSLANTLSVTLDCRLPVCADPAEVEKKIAACFPSLTLRRDRFSPNLYIPQDDKLVQALLDAYVETTGGERKCLYCGGGTYARELPNAVAFGPTFPDLITNIHNVDECFPVTLFDKLPALYEAAIRKLDEVF